MAKTNRTTWWDLLDKETREHVRKDAGVRSAAGLSRTIDSHNAKGFFCFHCRLAAQILRKHRPDLEIPEPLPVGNLADKIGRPFPDEKPAFDG
jgi:hypothetical protein